MLLLLLLNVWINARSEYGKSELLSQPTWKSSTAQQKPKFKETLNVTLSGKYDKGALVHISDDMFEWVHELKDMTVNLLNSKSVASHQEDQVENGLSNILGCNQLMQLKKGERIQERGFLVQMRFAQSLREYQ